MSVLIFGRAPRRGTVRSALEPLLGADGAARLHARLLVQAVRWARELEADSVHLAFEPADAGPEMAALLGPGVTLFPQAGEGISGRFRHAAGRVFEERRGPLLVVWPDLPVLRPDVGRAALADLEAGCDLVLGPVFDGGFYLVGLARPVPSLFALDEQAWRGPGAVGMALAAAAGNDGRPLEVGILRAERALHRPADVRALLADPLAPAELMTLLGPRAEAAGGL